MQKIPFRNDEYGRRFYIRYNGFKSLIPYRTGDYREYDIDISVKETMLEDALKIDISFSSKDHIKVDCFGLRLGIDCYMDSYPEWYDKYFPTALRCEKNGFWSLFMTPSGRMLSVCSPSGIVSWKNEYNRFEGDVGHRIYTSSVEFINTQPQPVRHPENRYHEIPENPVSYTLYYGFTENYTAFCKFTEKYAGIHIPKVNKYTLEEGEALTFDGRPCEENLHQGIHTIAYPGMAETTVYVRKDWFYYLDCARKSAELCQQKPGSHCESWYGYFTMAEYAKIVKSPEYTKNLCEKFDEFFSILTKGEKTRKMRKAAYPERLQNVSSMISLLTDFFELTGSQKYIEAANDMADWLMALQNPDDGSYRNRGVHYTCVIYPAKSMLELALAEKRAGLSERSSRHFESARKAIKDLAIRKDNVDTEGQITFEDGMITCSALQIACYALLTDNASVREEYTAIAEGIMEKHRCLEQQYLPDCRVRGCTLRFWEARYDLNFLANMLNSPHGWTSWKNYATYYLYLLTGKLSYLCDLMDTMGACMQCIDENGILRWGFVADPCIEGRALNKNCGKNENLFTTAVVGEQYLPMISDWYRQEKEKLVFQYIRNPYNPESWKKDYGGSCDNDVHEHFKCLCETVFGKAFIHECEDGTCVTYNCRKSEDGFTCTDRFVSVLVAYALKPHEMVFNSKKINLREGMNFINI